MSLFCSKLLGPHAFMLKIMNMHCLYTESAILNPDITLMLLGKQQALSTHHLVEDSRQKWNVLCILPTPIFAYQPDLRFFGAHVWSSFHGPKLGG